MCMSMSMSMSMILKAMVNLSDNHVDAVRPALYELEALEGEVQPLVGRRLQIRRQRHPLLALVCTQQTTHIVSWNNIR